MEKVLYIIDHLQIRSGIASVVMNYYRFFPKESLNVDFLSYDDNDDALVNEIIENGGSVFLIPHLSVRGLLRFVKAVKLFFQNHKNQYCIVHSHFPQIDVIVLPIAKKYGGVVHYISHSHNSKHADNFFNAIRNSILCAPLRFISDYRAACSHKAGCFMYGKTFATRSKDFIVNNAVDCKYFLFDSEIRKEIRHKLKLDDYFVIGSVGGLRIQKNYSFLLDVVKELCNRGLKCVLILVGEGPLKELLENKVESLNIGSNVRFLGRRTDVRDLYMVMDVFVLPSLYEGLPVVGVEAQAAGLPCLFSKNITEEVGLLDAKFLPVCNSNVWADEIMNVKCGNRDDALEKMKSMGFDIATEALKIEKKYREMVV